MMELPRSLSDFSEYRASAWALIAANCVPLLGVAFLGWDTFSIVALYWVENVIIGAINVLKMITCSPDPQEVDWSLIQGEGSFQREVNEAKRRGSLRKLQSLNHGSKIFLVPFFIVHYGIFCLVHGVFVFVIFGREDGDFGPFGVENALKNFSGQHLWWAVAALAASHLWSYYANYLGHGEYRRTFAAALMAQPYARVVVLHLAILFGGIISFLLGSNALVLIILVIGKTILDLSLHLREHARIAEPSSDQSAPPATVASGR